MSMSPLHLNSCMMLQNLPPLPTPQKTPPKTNKNNNKTDEQTMNQTQNYVFPL